VNTKFDKDGNLADKKTEEFLKTFIQALAVHSGIIKTNALTS